MNDGIDITWNLEKLFELTKNTSDEDLIKLRKSCSDKKELDKIRFQNMINALKYKYPDVKFAIRKDGYFIEIYCNDIEIHNSDKYIDNLVEISKAHLLESELNGLALRYDYFDEIDFEDLYNENNN